MMECWGEFLDAEWYYSPAPPPLVLEPWRSHPRAGECFVFPRSLIEELAQPDRLRDIRSDVERIGVIRSELLREGLREPLEVVVDAGGLVLWNGHHRLLASEGIEQFGSFPVVFIRSDGIRVRARPAADLLVQMLRCAKT